MKTTIRILLTTLMSLALSLSAMAQEESTGPSVREQVEQELEVFKTELALSDYTWTQVELILKSGIRERVAIAQRYGADGEGGIENMERKERRNMSKELKDSRKGTAKRMERYLDKDQMKQFKAFQEEQREKMLARLEEHQAES